MKTSKLILAGIIGSLALPIISISCARQQKILIDESKINTKYLTKLNAQQLASLHNFEPIFINQNQSSKTYLKYLGQVKKVTNNNELEFNLTLKFKPEFKLQKSWKQIRTKYDNYKIERTNNSTFKNFDDLFTQYDFKEIRKAGGYSNLWFYFLANKNKDTDYYRVYDPYFFDFQTVIFRLVNDIKTNSGLMNKNSLLNKAGEAFITRNIFNNEFIQASSWLRPKNEIFRNTFINFLILYLNKFDLNIKKINIDWTKARVQENDFSNQSFISFQIEDIIDFDDKSIINNAIKNKTFYINGFRNYATEQKFGVGNNGLSETLPLFNDYVKNPFLIIKQNENINLGKDINSFIKGYNSIDYWNSRGLVYLFSNFKDYLEFDIPEIYKNIDEKYKVIDIQFTNYYETSQLIKMIIRVFKKDKTTKDYVLLSSNFDDHGHFLKAISTKLAAVDKLESSDYAIYRKEKKPTFNGIKLDDFVNNPLFNSLINYALINWKKHIVNPNSNTQDQLKLLTAYLNNYLLAYALEIQNSNLNSGIKKIELAKNETVGDETTLKFYFYKFNSEKDFLYKNKGEKPFYYIDMKVKNLFEFSNETPVFTIVSKGHYNEKI
ncbi:MAG3240 family lipoprotein [Mycoplasma sp. 773]